MKIGKWFAKLALSDKVASISFDNHNQETNRADAAVIILAPGFANNEMERFLAISAHEARLFIQGARGPKAKKTEKLNLGEVGKLIAMEATRVKGKLSREKVRGRFLTAERLANEMVNVPQGLSEREEVVGWAEAMGS